LEWYDAIIHVDVDELLVAEPDSFSSLRDYVEKFDAGVVNAVGFDVHHLPLDEPKLNLALPVLKQRKWARFSSSMCKPVLTSKPIVWTPGFHSADAPISFRNLYLFHLRYFDLEVGLSRLRRTRGMAWADDNAGLHQRVEDDTFKDMMLRIARLPRIENITMLATQSPVSEYVERVLRSEVPYAGGRYNLDLHIFGDSLFEIPARFRSRF
jgi:hypothetical protein